MTGWGNANNDFDKGIEGESPQFSDFQWPLGNRVDDIDANLPLQRPVFNTYSVTATQRPAKTASPAFLATTALEGFWDTTGKVVFLSEACTRYSRSVAWSALDSETLPDPWDDPQARQQAYSFINELYERTLPFLGSRLNEIHGQSHSDRYWRVVTGHWLYHYISFLFDRHARLVRALDRFPDLTTFLLMESCAVTPKSTFHFIRLALEDFYNLQVCSRILRLLGKDALPTVSVLPPPTLTETCRFRDQSSFRERVRSIARGAATALLATLGRGRIVMYKSYFSRGFELRLALRSSGAVLPSFILDQDTSDAATNAEMRGGLVGLFSPSNEFETVLMNLLPLDLPRCFIEGYAGLAEDSRRFPSGPAAIFSANGWFYDETFKRWAAGCAEDGTLLLASQHGGGYYGLGTYFPSEDFELSIADRYYSWGWRPAGPGRDRVKIVAATLLSGRPRIPPDNSKAGVLYLATAEPRYMYSMQNTIGHFVRYLEWQKRFLDALPEAAKRVLRARLYPEDYGWDMRQRWSEYAPDVKVEDAQRPFLESLRDCRLFISDHLGTTFYEAMYANRPTILFFDPASNPLRDGVSLWIDRLRTAGILHDTPEGAALALAAAYRDVEAWWNDPERQAARVGFCAHFARTAADPTGDWLAEFNSMRPLGGRK